MALEESCGKTSSSTPGCLGMSSSTCRVNLPLAPSFAQGCLGLRWWACRARTAEQNALRQEALHCKRGPFPWRNGHASLASMVWQVELRGIYPMIASCHRPKTAQTQVMKAAGCQCTSSGECSCYASLAGVVVNWWTAFMIIAGSSAVFCCCLLTGIRQSATSSAPSLSAPLLNELFPEMFSAPLFIAA